MEARETPFMECAVSRYKIHRLANMANIEAGSSYDYDARADLQTGKAGIIKL